MLIQELVIMGIHYYEQVVYISKGTTYSQTTGEYFLTEKVVCLAIKILDN